MELCSITGLKGRVAVPGDKSISHRCIMFGSIADGTTEVRNFLEGADCLATIRCFRSLGIEIEEKDTSVIVHGKGLHGLSAPDSILDAGNSGTTTRLLSASSPASLPASPLSPGFPAMNPSTPAP